MTDKTAENGAIDVLMLLGTHCPHCPAVLAGLSELVKQGVIASLEVVNIERRPDRARQLGVRSVPWVRIGVFELTGLRSKKELQQWAEKAGTADGMAEYFAEVLNEGGIDRVRGMIDEHPSYMKALSLIIADPEAKLNARLGAGAVIEHFEGSEELRGMIPQLVELTRDEDARVRGDACHYLSLTHDESVRPEIERLLQDDSADVREVAQESLSELDAKRSSET